MWSVRELQNKLKSEAGKVTFACYFFLTTESKLDILLANNYIVCKVNFPFKEGIECEE